MRPLLLLLQIRVSFIELAHHTTWNEFHQNLTPELFYRYADLARDQAVVSYSLESPLPRIRIENKRCLCVI